MTTGDRDALDGAQARIRNEIYFEQRALLDKVDTVGICAIAIGVPMLLWGAVPSGRLVLWGVLLFAATLGWGSVTIGPATTNPILRVVRSVWIWGSSVLWAALPWLDISAAKDDAVAWILVFVVTYGIASDVVFIPQTDDTRLYRLLAGYTTSYIAALLVVQQWGPAVAVIGFLALLTAGGRGWQQLTGLLTEKRIESELRTLVDELTGAGTRFAATLAVNELRSTGVDIVRCIFLDVDDFKQLNDTYGYGVGDAALRVIADRLRAVLEADWQVSRFGGDEFVAVGHTEPRLEALHHIHVPLATHAAGTRLRLAVSLGTTALPTDAADPEVLFREAGAALRLAKTTGKNRVVEMTPLLRAREAERVALGATVSTALENEEIIAYGQAITDLHTGLPVGVELLARWPHPDGSLVMPNDFVPVIEEQGRGPHLGDLMMRYAVAFIADLQSVGVDVYATVNISARHLFHRNLPLEVAQLIENVGVPAQQLVLEITESQYLPESSIWRQTAAELREVGVGLAIDDFGTGYSSMEQLLSMPFSHLKVDRIITSSHHRPGATDLAAAIAAMATGGGMTAIAEGIETETECDHMLAAGYRYGQGFLFGRPAPLAEMHTALLAAIRAGQPEGATSTASDPTAPVQQ